MWKHCADFKQNYTLKLSTAFKMTYSCCFGQRGNLNFPDFLKKSFITSTTGAHTTNTKTSHFKECTAHVSFY